jgi:hypothetical protein
MSDETCGCGVTPCRNDPNKEYGPEDPVNPDPAHCTLATGDTTNNIFFVPRAPGYPPRCVLDELTYEQVAIILQRVPCAKADLMRITDDQILLEMARDSRLIESPLDEDERMRKKMHENTLPIYTVLNGNFDGTPR